MGNSTNRINCGIGDYVKELSIAAILGSVISGCALAPGMNFDGVPTVEGVEIRQITPDLLLSQEPQVSLVSSDRRLDTAGLKTLSDEPYVYRIGPRDILSVTVWDHPELTLPAGEFRTAVQAGHVVTEDGDIFYPFVGQLRVAGKTVSEVRRLLARELSAKVVDPQLDVRVVSYRSQRAFVVGEVTSPGPQEITDIPLTIVDAFSKAGEDSAGADITNVTLQRGNDTFIFNLLDIIKLGDVSKNYLLKDGDVLRVPDNNAQKVFVLGEVRQPSTVFRKWGKLTLTEALSAVGGVNQITSNPALMYVFRNAGESDVIYHLDSRSADALLLADKFLLEPRDVVYIGTAGVTRWNRVVSQILPTAQFLRVTSSDFYTNN